MFDTSVKRVTAAFKDQPKKKQERGTVNVSLSFEGERGSVSVRLLRLPRLGECLRFPDESVMLIRGAVDRRSFSGRLLTKEESNLLSSQKPTEGSLRLIRTTYVPTFAIPALCLL